jgi:hypothetical protein
MMRRESPARDKNASAPQGQLRGSVLRRLPKGERWERAHLGAKGIAGANSPLLMSQELLSANEKGGLVLTAALVHAVCELG